mmetsp:Transcript_30306/g.89882  ORF Transcript_30306/g.89882 Transcript_30306/m.89882 type:complete len:299 (-) Transcript_30306:688-1584(-)
MCLCTRSRHQCAAAGANVPRRALPGRPPLSHSSCCTWSRRRPHLCCTRTHLRCRPCCVCSRALALNAAASGHTVAVTAAASRLSPSLHLGALPPSPPLHPGESLPPPQRRRLCSGRALLNPPATRLPGGRPRRYILPLAVKIVMVRKLPLLEQLQHPPLLLSAKLLVGATAAVHDLVGRLDELARLHREACFVLCPGEERRPRVLVRLQQADRAHDARLRHRRPACHARFGVQVGPDRPHVDVVKERRPAHTHTHAGIFLLCYGWPPWENACYGWRGKEERVLVGKRDGKTKWDQGGC